MKQTPIKCLLKEPVRNNGTSLYCNFTFNLTFRRNFSFTTPGREFRPEKPCNTHTSPMKIKMNIEKKMPNEKNHALWNIKKYIYSVYFYIAFVGVRDFVVCNKKVFFRKNNKSLSTCVRKIEDGKRPLCVSLIHRCVYVHVCMYGATVRIYIS